MSDVIIKLIENSLWAGVASLGFAVLFNVPKHRLLLCTAGGVIGYAARTGLIRFAGVDMATATLVAAMLVSVLGLVVGRRWHAPALVFVIPGAIPLIPGALAFRTMIDIVVLATDNVRAEELVLVEILSNGISTILIVGAIAGGIAVPSLLLRRHRPLM